MECIDCGSNLEKIELFDEVGKPFEIYRCASCGGFWMPQDVIYGIKDEDIQKLDKPHNGTYQEKELRCPADNVVLQKYSEPDFPKGFYLLKCPECNWVWIESGKLIELEKIQKKREAAISSEVEEGGLQRKTMYTLGTLVGVLLVASVLVNLYLGKFSAIADVTEVKGTKAGILEAVNQYYLLIIFAALFIIGAILIIYNKKLSWQVTGWIIAGLGCAALVIWLLQNYIWA
jgi:Zn-finger nucleic acid-binding protein